MGGFTLIELMITVAVIAILATIAYPSYQNYLKRAKRSAAQSVLLDLASRQQAYLFDQRTYADTLAKLNFTTAPAEIVNDYDFQAPSSVTSTTFILTVQARAGSINAGDTNMTVNQAGVKTPDAYWKR